MNLDHVKRFVYVVNAGSLTSAARKLGVPKSSLSRQMNLLEQELSTKLMIRGSRQLELTEAGELLFNQAQDLILGLDEVEDNIAHLITQPSGTLRVQTPSEFMSDEIAQLAVEFAQNYPKIQLCLNQYPGAVPSPGDMDITIVNHDFQLAFNDLIARPLMSIPQSLYCSPHCAQGTPNIEFDALSQKQLITQPGEQYWYFREQNNRLSIPVNGRLILNSPEMRIIAAIRGMGIAKLPDYLVQHAVKHGSLIKVRTSLPVWAETVTLLYKHRQPPRKIQVFIEFVQNFIGRMQSRL
ncbi:LysR family transcriptional regulator [Gynuella sunshinyii]|uniref:Transcriptional regulator n=1 Tax=Gynuella sunshinyii YC6258 TaxID=1445510 RepID=A0A0C5VIB1_9GAMM|nr:LysR family transcriptional regulator [Gynuella sunshinyii]AJQ93093.1 transcriptional regulator [Gynuella sunshinyii YC6258]